MKKTILVCLSFLLILSKLSSADGPAAAPAAVAAPGSIAAPGSFAATPGTVGSPGVSGGFGSLASPAGTVTFGSTTGTGTASGLLGTASQGSAPMTGGLLGNTASGPVQAPPGVEMLSNFQQNNAALQQNNATMEVKAKNAAEAAAAGAADKTMSPEEKFMSADDEFSPKPKPFLVGKLMQFGYSFFSQQTTFAPIIDVPVGPDYLVGPGDTLMLTVWGALDATLPLEVNRNGEIALPRVGTVRVWGVPFGKVPELIQAALSRTFKTVHLNVTMGKLRLMKVYVVGEITNPGAYDISALSTVINALAAAGGPTKQGTLRGIQVLRNGHLVETVDLYSFFLNGDKSRDIRLQPGDTINVPIHGNLVGVAGNVRKPAIYELPKGATLEDLFKLAGGIAPSSYLQRIQLSRFVANDKKVVADFNFDQKVSGKSLAAQSAEVKLQDLDLVKVFPIDFTVRDQVQLTGYVLRPGGYALKPGMRLKDLLLPDNILPEYYQGSVEITRLVAPDLHPEKLFQNLDSALKGNEKDNILLREFDTVHVFSRWEMEEMPRATISGDVQKPGAYRIFPQMTLRDLILLAGNLKRTAYLNSAEITRTQVSKDGVKSNIINVDLAEALNDNPKDNIALNNFDEVVIRRVPDWKEETERYITLIGQVRFPGTYPILNGERLSSVIERAGGYTPRAYLKATKFTRKLTQLIQQKRMDEVIVRAEQDLMRKQQDLTSAAASKDELDATKTAIQGMQASLEKLKLAKAEGRISLQLGSIDELKKTPYDLELQGGDVLDIPESTNSIMVFGEVYNPTTVVQVPGGTVLDYLRKAGGPTTNAEEAETYVVRADGTVVSKREKRGFFHDSFLSMTLDAGDSIVVPQRLDKVAWMRELKDIAFIIGQTALAAGVLVAAGL
jgi:polysaccharide biosynthesis/export protein